MCVQNIKIKRAYIGIKEEKRHGKVNFHGTQSFKKHALSFVGDIIFDCYVQTRNVQAFKLVILYKKGLIYLLALGMFINISSIVLI